MIFVHFKSESENESESDCFRVMLFNNYLVERQDIYFCGIFRAIFFVFRR